MLIDQNTIAELKSQGFLAQKGQIHFACRIVPRAGSLTVQELGAVSRIAEKYGDGRAGLTQRNSIEISGISYDHIESVKKALCDSGLRCGGTGARVRPIVCCKGTYCQHGLIDTQALCLQLDNTFYFQPTPHKFKINIAGCPNNCTRVQLNDLGVQPFKGKLRLFVGGQAGRSIVIAKPLDMLVSLEELEPVIGKLLDFYREHGQPKERLWKTIKRLQQNHPDFSLEKVLFS